MGQIGMVKNLSQIWISLVGFVLVELQKTQRKIFHHRFDFNERCKCFFLKVRTIIETKYQLYLFLFLSYLVTRELKVALHYAHQSHYIKVMW